MSLFFINDSPELSVAAGTCRLSVLVSQLDGQGRGWEGGWVGGREEGREGRHETELCFQSPALLALQGCSQLSRGRVGPGMPPLHPHTDEPFLSKRNLRFVTSRPQVQRSLQCLWVKEHTPERDTPGSPHLTRIPFHLPSLPAFCSPCHPQPLGISRRHTASSCLCDFRAPRFPMDLSRPASAVSAAMFS